MLLCLVLSLVAIASAKIVPTSDPLSQEAIDYINFELKPTWKAGKNFGEGWKIDDIKAMCGVLPTPVDKKLPGIV